MEEALQLVLLQLLLAEEEQEEEEGEGEALLLPPLQREVAAPLLLRLALAPELATAWTAIIPIWRNWSRHRRRVGNASSATCSIP